MGKQPAKGKGRRSGSGSGSRAVAAAAATRAPISTSSSIPSQAIVEDEVSTIPLAQLTIDVPLIPLVRKPPKVPPTPFHFLTLPPELRIRIYNLYFDDVREVLDLQPDNWRRIHKKLGIMRVCRQVRSEATHFFYTTRTFRIFPTYPGKYFKTKKPLLARLKPHQRECITSLELRLGPGWNAPPKGWTVNEALGLKQCVNVQKLTIFVECDPSDGVFKGFRRSEGFYEAFSRVLLTNVLNELPSLRFIEFDAWPSVKKTGAMMQTLMGVVTARNKLHISWGPERGWTDDDDDDLMPLVTTDPNRPLVPVDGINNFLDGV